MTIGQRLIALRELRGLSQQQVADAINVQRSTYAKWETDSNKPVRKLQDIASFFNVSTDYLLGNSPNVTVCSSDDYTMPADAAPINKLIENLFADNPKALAILNGQKTPTMASGALANKKLEDMTDSEKEYIKNALLLGLKAGGFDV